MSLSLNSVNNVHPHVDNNMKRLLTINQVNEDFPVVRYKEWKAIREKNESLIEYGIITRNPPIHKSSDTTFGKSVLEQSEATIATQKPETTDDVSRISIKSAQAVNASSVLSNHCKTKVDDISPIPSVEVVEDKCAICLEVPEDDDVVRSLKCGHCYHQTCIDPWLTSQSGACPLCKRDFYKQQSTAERENTLLWTTNEHRSPDETSESNTRVQNAHRNGFGPLASVG